MKVSTDLKAGGMLVNAAGKIETGASQVAGVVRTADQQAKALTSGITNTATSAWNTLTRTLGY